MFHEMYSVTLLLRNPFSERRTYELSLGLNLPVGLDYV